MFGGDGNNSGNDNAIYYVGIIVLAFLLLRLVWPHFVHVLVYISYWENAIIYKLCSAVGLAGECGWFAQNANVSSDIVSLGVKNYSPADANAVRAPWSQYFGVIVPSLIFLPIAWLFFKRDSNPFTENLSPQQVLAIQARSYYPVRSMVGRNYERRPPGHHREFSLKPWLYAIYNKILISEKGKIELIRQEGNTITLKPTPAVRRFYVYDEERAYAVFKQSLGARLWSSKQDPIEGIMSLPSTTKAIIVAFMSDIDPRITTYSADHWLERFSNSFYRPKASDYEISKLKGTNKIFSSFVEAVPKLKERLGLNLIPITLENFDARGVDEELRKILSQPKGRRYLTTLSAYEYTLLNILANKSAVSTRRFPWYKEIDRVGFYACNNRTRPQTFHVEAYGVIAHAQYEMMTKTPLVTPHFDKAIPGLRNYLIKHRWLDPQG